MHVGAKNTALALPGLIEDLEERGYEFVGLREAARQAGRVE